MRRARVMGGVLLGAAVLLAGCSGDDEAPAGPRLGGGCSAEAAAECRVDQKGCDASGGAPECFSCATGSRAGADGVCAAIAGTPMPHRFSDFTTMPGEELAGLCQSWTLGNEEDLYVSSVELVQNQMSHHSNWLWVPDHLFEGPDGVWPCAERDYAQTAAVLGGGGVVYAQSTQATHEVQTFPNGAAVRIPAHARIIGGTHILNVGATPVTGHIELTLYTLPPDQVSRVLAPFHLDIHSLEIQPRSTTRHQMRCDVGAEVRNYMGRDLEMVLYWALPHTHALGSRVFLDAIGGEHDGESLLDLPGFDGEAHGISYDPPRDLAGVTGFHFGCEWDNPRAEAVHWGIGDQEMCEILGFVDERVVFESTVHEVREIEPDGAVRVFEGACETLLVPWDSRR